jgi:hypothetical protein
LRGRGGGEGGFFCGKKGRMEGSWRHLGKETEVPGGAKQKGADEEEADKDFYAFLNLSPDCTLDDIKTAYKRLALIWHPDRHSDQVSREHATAKFARLTYINEILIDPSKRQVCTHSHSPFGLQCASCPANLGARDGGGLSKNRGSNFILLHPNFRPPGRKTQ